METSNRLQQGQMTSHSSAAIQATTDVQQVKKKHQKLGNNISELPERQDEKRSLYQYVRL
jgi:hypothetical protein